MTKRTWRDVLYSRIKLSVGAMNAIICVIVAAIVIFLIIGVIVD